MNNDHPRVANGTSLDSSASHRLGELLDGEILPRLERPSRYVGPFEPRGIVQPAVHATSLALVWPSVPEGHKLPTSLAPLTAALRVRTGLPSPIACCPSEDLRRELSRSGLPCFTRPAWRDLRSYSAWLVWIDEPLQLLGLLSILQLCGLPARAADRSADAPKLFLTGPGVALATELCAVYGQPMPPAASAQTLLDEIAGASHPTRSIAGSETVISPIEFGDSPINGTGFPEAAIATRVVTAADLVPQEPHEESGVTEIPLWAASRRLRGELGLGTDHLDEWVDRVVDDPAGQIHLLLAIGLPGETDADRASVGQLIHDLLARLPRTAKQLRVTLGVYAPSGQELANGYMPAPPHASADWLGSLGDDLRRRKVRHALPDPTVGWTNSLLAAAGPSAAEALGRVHEAGAGHGETTLARNLDLWHKALQVDHLFAGLDSSSDELSTLPTALARVVKQGASISSWVRDDAHPEPTGLAQPAPASSRPQHDAEATRRAQRPDPSGGRSRRADDRWKRWQALAPRHFEYRLEYSKRGQVRFLGHRELSDLILEACRGAQLPVATAGIVQPRPKVSFSPPLPVGVEGVRECVDLCLTRKEPHIQSTLNEQLPEGLWIRRVRFIPSATSRTTLGHVARAEYEVELSGERALAAVRDWISTRGTMDQDEAETKEHQICTLNLDETGELPRVRFSLDLTVPQAKLRPLEVLSLLVGDLDIDIRTLPMRRTSLLVSRNEGDSPFCTPMEQVEHAYRQMRARAKLCA